MNEQAPQRPTCPEHRQEMERLVEKAAKLASMTRTPGWHEVLEPMLQERRQNKVMQLCEEVEYENVRRLQVGIQEIDAVLGFVNTTILMATAAQEALEEED